MELTVADKFTRLSSMMNEKLKRRWAGCEAMALGRGGISAVAEATGMSRATIRRGLREIQLEYRDGNSVIDDGRIRSRGGGRRRKRDVDSTLIADLKTLIDPATRGEPTSPLLWTSKSTRTLADELQRKGHNISYRTVARLLGELGYSLQSNLKTREGIQNPDRNAQFEYINKEVKRFQRQGQPAISVDAKKRENIGDFKNTGREWRPKGEPEEVRIHDFKDKELGVGIPYGVYDLTYNKGWVSIGIDHNTAEFAASTIYQWWIEMGSKSYPLANELLITADSGSSNSNRVRLWKTCLQRLSDMTGLKITVCHFPPGTSKWNKIEHRMFCHITQNWRGRPLTSRAIIVNLISHVKTSAGLKIKAKLDRRKYPVGKRITDREIAAISITPHPFHGEWNYSIAPRLQ